MKFLSSALTVWMVVFTSLSAVPTVDDPRIKDALDNPDTLAFTSSYAKVLLEIPAADIAVFRASLRQAVEKKTLPRRHAGKAMEMTDIRWAETDSNGFFAACKDKDAQVSYHVKAKGVIHLIDTDPQAAIRTFQDLGLHQNMGEAALRFFAALAAKDAALGWATFLDLDKERKLDSTTATIIRIWAKQNAPAAWDAVVALPERLADTSVFPRDPSDTWNLRALVCAAAMRKDEAMAERFLDSIELKKHRDQVLTYLAIELARTDPDRGLALSLRLNSPEITTAFAGNARWRTDEETLRKLLELVPKEHLRDYLIAFFTSDNSVLLPDFRYAALLPRVTDRDLRRAIILAMLAEFSPNTRIEVPPAAVTDAALAEGSELMTLPMKPEHRKVLILAILEKDPALVLPWILVLSDAEWNEHSYIICWKWPMSDLPARVPLLLSAGKPRESAIAKALLRQWWGKDPLAAFPIVKDSDPDLIRHSFRPDAFLKGCGGDLTKARELLATVPDPAVREIALKHYSLAAIKEAPAAEALESLLQQLDAEKTDKFIEESRVIAGHAAPEMDGLILAIPDGRAAVRDRLLGMRAPRLFKNEEEARAFALWRKIQNEEVFFGAIADAGSGYAPTKIKDWKNFTATVAMRPVSARRTRTLQDFAETMARYAPESALAVADAIDDLEARSLILMSFAKSVETPALLKAGLAILGKLPENDDTQPVHNAWLQAIAHNDPAQGWAIAVKRGLDDDKNQHIGLIAINRLALQDPKAALALLMDAAPSGLRYEFLVPVMKGLAEKDPAAALRAASAMPPDVRGQLSDAVLSAWIESDPAAACAACLEMERSTVGERHLFSKYLSRWLNKDQDKAIAWLHSLALPAARVNGFRIAIPAIASKDPTKAAHLFAQNTSLGSDARVVISVARGLAVSDYAAACRFLVNAYGGAERQTIASSLKDIIVPWFAADPKAAAVFLKSLPPSTLTHLLDHDLRDLLLQRYGAALDGWNPPPTASTRETPESHRMTLAEVIALPDDATKISAIHKFVDWALQENRPDDIPAVLEMLKQCEAAMSDTRPSLLPRLAEMITTTWISNPRRHALIHRVLQTLPEEEAMRISIALFLSKGQGIPGFEEAFLHPGPALSPIPEVLDRLNKALLQKDFHNALLAAVEVPDPHQETLTIRILSAFPTAADAEAAIRAIPDQSVRERTLAWLRQLK